MNQTDAIHRICQAFDLTRNAPMKQHTSFRVGGPADLLALPETREELRALLAMAGKEAVPVTIVGGGSNLLVSDKGIRGLVVVLTRLRSGISAEPASGHTVLVSVAAGERLSSLCRYAAEKGLAGLSFCAGIPGTVGGAAMMNAGSADRGFCDTIQRLNVLNCQTLAEETIFKTDLSYAYRNLELSGRIILGLDLGLTRDDPESVGKRHAENVRRKRQTQPVAQASAGCFFKNPGPDMPAGKLIQDAGLKGKTLNHARVSDIHANYIINTGNASCRDILALKTLVQETVFRKYGIQLETEVKVTGDE